MPWGTSKPRAHHLPEKTFQEMIALRNSGLDFNICGFPGYSLEEYFVPGEEEDGEESQEDDEEDE